MYYIEIVQLNGKRYFWLLKNGKEALARSRKIEPKDVIEQEAEKVAAAFDLPIIVNERK